MVSIVRKVATVAVAVSLTASTAAAADLTKSIEQAVQKEAAAQSQQASQRQTLNSVSPYVIPGIALVGAGVPLLLYGVLKDQDIACTVQTIRCPTKVHTGMVIAGTAAAGAGAFLLFKAKQHSRPELLIGVGRVAVRQQLRW